MRAGMFATVAVYLTLFAILGALVALLRYVSLRRGTPQACTRAWAREKGYELLELERKYFWPGLSPFGSQRHAVIFRVRVKDSTKGEFDGWLLISRVLRYEVVDEHWD